MSGARGLAPAAVALLLAAVLLGGQAAADALVPVSAHAGTGDVLGRAGFAYLGGIRTFAAAALWARLDPINDGYYENLALGEKRFLLPSIRIITWLDPQLEEPYYVGPYVLYEARQPKGALEIAAEGVANNPRSAFLHASYAQVLLLEKRLSEARREADLALVNPWSNESDEYQLLASLVIVFDKTGAPDKADLVRAERERLRRKFGLGTDAPSTE